MMKKKIVHKSQGLQYSLTTSMHPQMPTSQEVSKHGIVGLVARYCVHTALCMQADKSASPGSVSGCKSAWSRIMGGAQWEAS
jgi:hypothetical protein